MSATINRRIADRRRAVVEDGARRRLRRLLVFLLLVGMGGFAGWMLYQSPLLAVTEVVIDGSSESRAAEIVAAEGVTAGVPTINVRAGAIETALLGDPWIAAASVQVTWPGTVEIEVLERTPAAWVEAGEVWLLADGTGAVLEVAATEPEDGPMISVGTTATVPGGHVERAAVAALEFLESLGEDLAANASVQGSADALEAIVGGHEIALGYSTDMKAKAAAVSALLDTDLPPGAVINVVSPERPAVKSQPDVETLREVLGDEEPSG